MVLKRDLTDNSGKIETMVEAMFLNRQEMSGN